MSDLTLRGTTYLLLILGTKVANAAILLFTFSGPVAYSPENWTGPGPAPESFELSFTVDSLSFTSSSITYIDGDPTGAIQSYRFYGVEVLSVSFIANESEVWNQPAGLTLEFGCDSSDPGSGWGFCYLGGTNPLDQSLGSSYDDIVPPGSQLGDDPLAAILLAQTPLSSSGDPLVYGEWGGVRGSGPLYISAIPIPAAAWLFASALGVMGWLRRRAA